MKEEQTQDPIKWSILKYVYEQTFGETREMSLRRLGITPETECVCVFGPPASGKSYNAVRIAAFLGREWLIDDPENSSGLGMVKYHRKPLVLSRYPIWGYLNIPIQEVLREITSLTNNFPRHEQPDVDGSIEGACKRDTDKDGNYWMMIPVSVEQDDGVHMTEYMPVYGRRLE